MATASIGSESVEETPTLQFTDVHHLFNEIDHTAGDTLLVIGMSRFRFRLFFSIVSASSPPSVEHRGGCRTAHSYGMPLTVCSATSSSRFSPHQTLRKAAALTGQRNLVISDQDLAEYDANYLGVSSSDFAQIELDRDVASRVSLSSVQRQFTYPDHHNSNSSLWSPPSLHLHVCHRSANLTNGSCRRLGMHRSYDTPCFRRRRQCW